VTSVYSVVPEDLRKQASFELLVARKGTERSENRESDESAMPACVAPDESYARPQCIEGGDEAFRMYKF